MFFLALVMLINARDMVFEMAGEPARLIESLAEMPQALNAEDIPDMCELAMHYSAQTPPSLRTDYHPELFMSATVKRTKSPQR